MAEPCLQLVGDALADPGTELGVGMQLPNEPHHLCRFTIECRVAEHWSKFLGKQHNSSTCDGLQYRPPECLHNLIIVKVNEVIDAPQKLSDTERPIGHYLPISRDILTTQQRFTSAHPSHDAHFHFIRGGVSLQKLGRCGRKLQQVISGVSTNYRDAH